MSIIMKDCQVLFFCKTISNPMDIPTYSIGCGINVVEQIASTGLCKSRSEIRRLITQNAITLDGEVVKTQDLTLQNPGILKIGKRRFVRLLI